MARPRRGGCRRRPKRPHTTCSPAHRPMAPHRHGPQADTGDATAHQPHHQPTAAMRGGAGNSAAMPCRLTVPTCRPRRNHQGRSHHQVSTDCAVMALTSRQPGLCGLTADEMITTVDRAGHPDGPGGAPVPDLVYREHGKAFHHRWDCIGLGGCHRRGLCSDRRWAVPVGVPPCVVSALRDQPVEFDVAPLSCSLHAEWALGPLPAAPSGCPPAHPS